MVLAMFATNVQPQCQCEARSAFAIAFCDTICFNARTRSLRDHRTAASES
jgi:hypothetical protein